VALVFMQVVKDSIAANTPAPAVRLKLFDVAGVGVAFHGV
jgi:hypothetical protein